MYYYIVILATIINLYLAIAHIATLFCKGWNEGNGAQSMHCSMPFLSHFAEVGYNFLTFSSFTLGLPHLIICIIAIGSSLYLSHHNMLLFYISLISSVLFTGLLLYGIYLVFFT